AHDLGPAAKDTPKSDDTRANRKKSAGAVAEGTYERRIAISRETPPGKILESRSVGLPLRLPARAGQARADDWAGGLGRRRKASGSAGLVPNGRDRGKPRNRVAIQVGRATAAPRQLLTGRREQYRDGLGAAAVDSQDVCHLLHISCIPK